MKPLISILTVFLPLLIIFQGCEQKKTETGEVRIHELTYQTPGVDGNLVAVSGLVMLPPSGNGPFPLISCQHGTIFYRKVAPSYLDSCPEAQAWMMEVAAKGYVVVMADYIGLGKAGTHAFGLNLLENEVFDWSPKAPTRLVFSMGDEVVPYAIENKAFARWLELNGNVDSINLGQKYNHADGFLPALQEAKKWFDSFL